MIVRSSAVRAAPNPVSSLALLSHRATSRPEVDIFTRYPRLPAVRNGPFALPRTVALPFGAPAHALNRQSSIQRLESALFFDSSGERARLLVDLVAMAAPHLLILDEPTIISTSTAAGRSWMR
jgi:ABC-type uncharacterized transport system YnjBCD ATPase subunit